jgi:hypothetical protein
MNLKVKRTKDDILLETTRKLRTELVNCGPNLTLFSDNV